MSEVIQVDGQQEQVVEKAKAAYKRLPLTADGQLIKNEFKLKSPRNLVIVKYPKSGASLSICDVPKILILDTEDGTDYFAPDNVVKLNDMSVADQFKSTENYGYIPQVIYETVTDLYKANKMKAYWALYNKMEFTRDLQEKEKMYYELIGMINQMPFPIIAVDTITSLVNISNEAALFEYNKTVKEDLRKADIKRVDKYGGAQYIRRKFSEIKRFFEEQAAPFVQFHGHVGQRKKVLEKSEQEVTALDIALEGIMSTTFTQKADAVATFYRDTSGCWLDFTKKDETDLGSRPAHLGNQLIKIAELVSDEDLARQIRPKTHWQQIYPEIKFI